MRYVITFAIALSLATAAALAAPPAPTVAPAANTPAAQLHALFDRAWQQAHPKPAAGSTDYKQLWGDPSIAHEQARLAQDKANLAALKSIDVTRLDPTDQLSYRLFEYQLNDAIAGAAFADDAQGLITQLWGPQLAGIEFKGESFGLIIDEVGEVLSLDTTKFEPNPVNIDPSWVEILAGVYRMPGELLLVLDVERALARISAALAA